MKWWKKWSYLGIWMICGFLVMTATDSWAAVREPGYQARKWILNILDEVSSGSEGRENPQPGTPGGVGNRESQESGDSGDTQIREEVSAGSGSQEGQSGNVPEEPGTSTVSEGEIQPGTDGSEGSGVSEGSGGPEGQDAGGDVTQPGTGSSEGSGDQNGQGDVTQPGTGNPEGSGGTEGSGGPGGQGAGVQPVTEPQEPEVTYRNPEDVVYTTVEDDYFADAVFIGDSRMVGMYEYGELIDVSTFYVSKGMMIFHLLDAQIVEVEGQTEKITVEQALSERQFAKIYLEVGINEMGTGDLDRFLTAYQNVLTRIQELQPDAIIYVQAIMKVTSKRSAQGDYITNEGIEARNEGLAALVDNVKTYYLDVNPLVTDETGGLNPDYTFDGVHLKGKDVLIWKNFLKEHAISLD